MKTMVNDTSATAAVSSTKHAKRRVAVAHTLSKDPFVGKSVAFGVNSDVGKEFISLLGKKWVAKAICYHLDSTHGHIVRTIVKKSRCIGKKKNDKAAYDVVWGFQHWVSPMCHSVTYWMLTKKQRSC